MKHLYRLWFYLTKPAGLIDWLGEGAKHVSQEEAERRAKICMGCPNMVHGSDFFQQSSFAIKNKLGLKVENESALKTCRSCSCPLALKVHVPYEEIKKWQRDYETELLRKANRNCWQI
jgi:hypothetical protein